jgi:hypothetical protein
MPEKLTTTTNKLPTKEKGDEKIEQLKKEIINNLNNCTPLVLNASLKKHIEKINALMENYPPSNLKHFANNLKQIPPLAKQFKILLSKGWSTTDFFIKIIPIYNKVDPLAKIINKTIGYELIPNLLTIANYYLEFNNLQKNISISGYPDNLIQRVQQDINRSEEEKIDTNFFALSTALEKITKKIKHANENFDINNPLLFTETVSTLFNVNFHN